MHLRCNDAIVRPCSPIPKGAVQASVILNSLIPTAECFLT